MVEWTHLPSSQANTMPRSYALSQLHSQWRLKVWPRTPHLSSKTQSSWHVWPTLLMRLRDPLRCLLMAQSSLRRKMALTTQPWRFSYRVANVCHSSSPSSSWWHQGSQRASEGHFWCHHTVEALSWTPREGVLPQVMTMLLLCLLVEEEMKRNLPRKTTKVPHHPRGKSPWVSPRPSLRLVRLLVCSRVFSHLTLIWEQRPQRMSRSRASGTLSLSHRVFLLCFVLCFLLAKILLWLHGVAALSIDSTFLALLRVLSWLYIISTSNYTA